MIIEAAWNAPSRVRAVTTTRQGGVSPAPYDSFNLATHVGDNPQRVKHNRQSLAEQLALPGPVQWLQQVHGTKLVAANPGGDIPQADAVWTDKAGLVCAVMTADCLPVLLCESRGRWVAAVHAGWRGLAAGIVAAAIEQLRQPDEKVSAWLGPAIGPAHFEVGAEVREAFIKRDGSTESCFKPSPKHDGRFLADLYALARCQLQRVDVSQVEGGQYCTYADPGHFYSYRRDGVTGRMATLIWIQP